MTVDPALNRYRDLHHRTVLNVAIVDVMPRAAAIIVGVRIEGSVLVPFNRRAVPGRFHVELAGVKSHRLPSRSCNTSTISWVARGLLPIAGPWRCGALMRRTPRLVRGMRFLEVVDLVVGDDKARVAHERVGDPAQCFHLLRRQKYRGRDEPVAPIGSEVGLREHGSSVRHWAGAAVLISDLHPAPAPVRSLYPDRCKCPRRRPQGRLGGAAQASVAAGSVSSAMTSSLRDPGGPCPPIRARLSHSATATGGSCRQTRVRSLHSTESASGYRWPRRGALSTRQAPTGHRKYIITADRMKAMHRRVQRLPGAASHSTAPASAS